MMCRFPSSGFIVFIMMKQTAIGRRSQSGVIEMFSQDFHTEIERKVATNIAFDRQSEFQRNFIGLIFKGGTPDPN